MAIDMSKLARRADGTLLFKGRPCIIVAPKGVAVVKMLDGSEFHAQKSLVRPEDGRFFSVHRKGSERLVSVKET